MLEDKIILQDRGFDAGLAALMQNANKGMDPNKCNNTYQLVNAYPTNIAAQAA